MQLRSISPTNYKSFNEGEVLPLGAGFNVIIGQNNVGKSALLESCNINALVNHPHKNNERNKPHQLSPNSIVKAVIQLTGVEFIDALMSQNGATHIMFPPESEIAPRAYLDQIASADVLTFDVEFLGNSTIGDHSQMPKEFIFSIDASRAVQALPSGKIKFAERSGNAPRMDEILKSACANKCYGFKAERFSVGQHNFEDSRNLAPDASNLPVVLNHIQGHSPNLFRSINDYMAKIFPSIDSISVGPSDRNLVIYIWSADNSQLSELAMPLNNSGTGIGQALAILTSASIVSSGVIIIDEMSSFLHPQAVKTLINILKTEFPQHQYIVSTHTFDVLRWSEPRVVALVRREDTRSKVGIIDPTDVAELRSVASEIGFSPSDVFGVEKILWVEGPTEEDCFPHIARAFSIPVPESSTVVALSATSPFSTERGARATAEVYDKVFRASSPFAKGVVIAVDREGHSEQTIKDIRASTGNRVVFSGRRTYENYLIHPGAIAEIINANLIEAGSEGSFTDTDISSWLATSGGDAKYKSQKGKSGGVLSESWLVEVDGARLLDDLFQEITAARLAYRKRKNGLELTHWLIVNQPNHLEPLATHVRDAWAAFPAA